jgi:DNA polymerase (family X)
MENDKIAGILDKMADLLELQEGNPFRIRSFRGAARAVRNHSERLEKMIGEDQDITKISGIGEGIAERIHEIVERGTCEDLEKLEEKTPENLAELLDVPGLGPEKVIKIHNELDVSSLEDLRKAAWNNEIQTLEGLGKKSEQNILEGIDLLSKTRGRFLRSRVDKYVDLFGRHLDDIDGIEKWEVAGSYRRGKETVGDLDILVQCRDRDTVSEKISDFKAIEKIKKRGSEKMSVVVENGLQIDIVFCDNNAFGSALMYLTGSKQHSVNLRKKAAEKQWKLSEKGLFNKQGKRLAGKTEKAVYNKLSMDWLPPELRENGEAIKAAESGDIPDLIELDDIQGDLHTHTDFTDGNETIERMVEAAIEKGYRYFGITEHTKAVKIAGGLDEKGVETFIKKLRDVDNKYSEIKLFGGVEVDILEAGDLDLDTSLLEEMDIVVASIHYHMKQTKTKLTARLEKALSQKCVNVFGHPLGRKIGSREALSFDLDEIFYVCKENKVAVEINSQPDRLDLPDKHHKAALEKGVLFVINSDAHSVQGLNNIEYGVKTARRGWLKAENVINTFSLSELEKFLKK